MIRRSHRSTPLYSSAASDVYKRQGMPWDPSDPKDPYLPKPDDKEEPTNPENPDIEKEETYMRVEAKVLQWNLVSRDVVLE